jgi:Raf kinase inhibitor-like YbhB/YbcL family protein
MKLSSPDFEHNQLIPSRFTCDGENVSPILEIDEVPVNTQSFVLIMDDPDAPTGTWVHWLVWNIPPETKRLISGSLPVGSIEGATDFGKPGYGGPCPPNGTHRYFFKVYALDKKLDLIESTKCGELLQALHNHIIATGELVGLYGRQD